MKNVFLLAASLTICVVPAVANAQPTPTSPSSGTGATPAAEEQSAQGLSDQAYDAYEKGNFPKAISLYMESYKLVPTGEILYNVASIYDKKVNDPKLAIEYYRRYSAAPDAKGELVGKSTARIAALQAQLDNQNGGRAGGDAGSGAGDRDASSGSGFRIAGIITAAVGIAGIGVGAATGIVASGKHSDAKDAGCHGATCPTEDARNKEKDAGTMANISTIGFIAGGVLLAGGIAMYVFAPKVKRSTTTGSSIVIAPQADAHGGGFAMVGRF